MSAPLPSLPDLDPEALYGALKTGVAALLAQHSGPTHLVGIASGGAWLAERLQRDLGLPGPANAISSAMHRDDFAQRGLATSSQTALHFEVNQAHVLLIDDVLYTGRTLRAVINELYDHGRPASVRLAVLVDRGGRQLPVQAQFAATQVDLPDQQLLELGRGADGGLHFVLERAQ